jgi:hypothetical protein
MLAVQWTGLEQDLAEDHAEGITDNSAPRATLRAQRETNILLRAQMLIGMMKDAKCSLPKSPPSYVTYALPALTCRTDMMKSYSSKELPASCDRKKWTPI